MYRLRLTTVLVPLTCLTLVACADDDASSEPAGTQGTGSTGSSSSTGEDRPADTGTSTGLPDTGGGSSTGEPLTRIEAILAALDTAMFQCPGRAWPDSTANFQSRQVLLVSEQDAVAYLWNDQTAGTLLPTVTELDYAGLDSEWYATFNFGFLDGVHTLGISLDDTAITNEMVEMQGAPAWHDYAVQLAFHEGMHFLSGQADWNVMPGSRSLPYPEPWEPRYLRAQTGWAMRAALEAGGTPDLSAAAYWREQSLAQFPNELAAIAAYDITEGSAEYGSAMLSALAELGCGASDEAFVDAVVERLDIFSGLSGYSGGREPYDLGVLAGLLLQRLGAEGWQGQLENSVTMQSMLLGGIAGVPQPDDRELQAGAMTAVEERNTVAAAQIEPLIANMADPGYFRLPVPFNWIAGSFSLQGFYYLADDPSQPELMLNFGALFETSTGNQIEATGLTSLYGLENPCAVGPNTIVLTISADEITDNGDGTFTASTDFVAFEALTATVLEDPQALPWLCPEQAAAVNPGRGGSLGNVAVEPMPGQRAVRLDG